MIQKMVNKSNPNDIKESGSLNYSNRPESRGPVK
jgi:hypothetical protein